MKRIGVILFLLMLGVSFMQAQEEPLPFSYEVLKNKSADGIYSGKSYDEVWTAITKTLMELEYRITASDKDGGTILAYDLDFKDNIVDILVDKRDEKIGIICKQNGEMFTATLKSFYKKFYVGIAKKLYGDDVIPKKKKKK
jgi:hypothetical protein